MKKVTVVPLVSVGEARFGMSRAEIRNLFGEYSEFRKSQKSKSTTDDFGFCHVYYDENDCCEAVELFDAEVLVEGKTVFPSSVQILMESFPNAIEESGCYTDQGLSVGFCAPDGNAESILFGKKGYYS